MPNYQYKCDTCSYEFEIHQSFHDSPLIDCPQCQHPTLLRILFAPRVFVKQSYNDISDAKLLGERNLDQLGPEKKQQMYDKYAKKEPTPKWYNEYAKTSNKKIAKMTPKQQQQYIVDGTVPN